MKIRHNIVALLTGSLLSAGTIAVAFATGSGKVIGTIVLSGAPTAYVIEHLLPTSFLYWLAPEGGGAAAVLIFVFSSWLQITILFTAIVLFVRRRRSNGSINSDWLTVR